MSKEAADAIAARVAKLGAGASMRGEGGDRRFRAHGRSWRVRVRVLEEVAPAAPVNGDPDLAPARVGLSVSVAALDSKGKVARDEAGRLLVFPATVLTLQEEAFAQPGFDPKKEILLVVADQVDAATAQIAGRRKLPGALAAWSDGGGES